VGEAVALYLDDKSEILSHKRAKVAWKAAAPFWSDMTIGRIDEKTPLAYRKHRSHCRAITVRNELAVIRAALNYAKKRNAIQVAPFIEMPKLPRAETRSLTKAQFRKLYDGAEGPHVKLFMALAVGTGARMTALLELTWDRVNFDTGFIDLNPADRVQTSKYRASVPMNAQLRAQMQEAKEGALSDYVIEYAGRQVASIKTGWNAAVRRSGVKATPHMLRHSAAVWMAEAGQTMDTIAQFLGHTDSRITARVYARFSPRHLADAAESLTW
jgi:integrase